MRLIAIEKELCPLMLGEKEVLLTEQSKAIYDLYLKGYIREIHQKEDSSEVILIMECLSQREATSLLAKLPLVRTGKASFDLTIIKPYEGYKLLWE